MITVILCALAAAVLYGTGAAFEQHQAAAAPASSAGRPKLLGLLIRQPAWLLGIAAQIGGFAAHAAALRSGPLTVVQMVVAAELIVSVAIVRVRSRRPLPPGALAAGATVIGGIVAFLALTSTGHADAHREAAGLGAAGLGGTGLGAAVTAAAAIVAAAVGLSRAGRSRALVLGLAAGLTDACLAVITSALSREFGHGTAAVLGRWPVYALVVAGLGSVLLTQTAYQAARPMITLPVIAAVTPIASVAVGLGFLGEGAHLGGIRIAAAGVVAAVTGAALVVLARSAPSGPTSPAPERAGADGLRPGTPTARPRTPIAWPTTEAGGERGSPEHEDDRVAVTLGRVATAARVSGGAVQESTLQWTTACLDEAWVVITSDDADSVDIAQLRADIDALHGQEG